MDYWKKDKLSGEKILIIWHPKVEKLWWEGMIKGFKFNGFEDFKILLPLPKRKGGDFNSRLISRVPLFPSLFGYHYGWFTPRVKEILLNFKPDIIYLLNEPWSFIATYTLWLKKRLLPRTKVIFFTWQNIYKLFPPPFSFFEKYVLKNSNGAICGNSEAGEIIKRKGYRGKIRILPEIGIDPEIFRPLPPGEDLRGKIGLKEKIFTIGYAGRLVREKGLELLLEAVSQLSSPFQLLLVGEGRFKNRLWFLAKRLRIEERIYFTGKIPYTWMPLYYNLMDVFVLPSLTTSTWKEQFGRVIIEAMACEVPVIGSSSGEIPRVIGEEELIFPEGDKDILRKKIEKLATNEKLREGIGKRARERIIQNYSWTNICRELLSYFGELR